MGQDMLARPRWKILNSRLPATVSDVIDIILHNRNLDAAALAGELKDLAEHLCIRGMSEGAGLLAKHMADCDKIVVVADYDCDGITSAAQMALFFQEIGYRCFEVVIPSRREGYGIPERAISDNPEAKVFIALDCGTLDFEPVRRACSMGADFIVIDHHEVPSDGSGHKHAPATVLINPKHPDCGSSFKEFCASGLTFLFLAALRQALRSMRAALPCPQLGGKFLALAATGTVADLVPLVSANRILARSGLRNLNANSFAPLSHLAAGAGLAGKTLTAGHIGFYLGPRINAAGRVSEGQIAYELLTSQEPAKLARLAAELEELNGQRRAQEEKIVGEIASRLAQNPPTGRTLVLGSAGWRPGVVGIAASRVQQDLFYAPVVIFSIDEAAGIARGSARSIPGFNIHHALSLCSDLLIRWGGHKAAAGLTIAAERIEEFADRMEEIAREYPAQIFVPRGNVDLELPLALVGPQLVEALEDLEPHGIGNPAPVFALRGARFNCAKIFGKEQNHLRLEFGNGLEAIWWRGAHRFARAGGNNKNLSGSGPGQAQDMIFRIGWNTFRKKPALEIMDLGDLFASRSE
ncbi:MAG: DHHA1 domain-containing protein [Deltaproteobacteria bacterium]|jgi:single-stranded-DNA-specific exonuclease|nr:DHHA1 domain-containing protein [Deltaproteobacteria bacterium]